MKRRVVVVKRNNPNDEFQTLYEWYEEKLAASDKRAEAFVAELYNTITDRDATIRKQEDTIYELKKTIATLENMVEVRDKRIAILQETIDRAYADLGTVSELKHTIAARDNTIAFMQGEMDFLKRVAYTNAHKK